MTIIISPAKKLTPTNNSLGLETTTSEFPDKLNVLVDYAKSLSEIHAPNGLQEEVTGPRRALGDRFICDCELQMTEAICLENRAGERAGRVCDSVPIGRETNIS